MNEASSEMNEQSDKEMSTILALVMTNNNIQAIMPKSMIPDPEWFNENRTTFED